MHGSWSIKAVLPTVAPNLDYSNLEDVQHDQQAQQAYLKAIASDTPAELKAALRQALSSYCERDTEAMVRLARSLSGTL